jgi:protein SCO1/2
MGRLNLGVLLVAAVLLGCGGDRAWDVHGVVLDVQPENAQVLIEHEEIVDFMPAMTMNFDVKDAGILAGVERGHEVDFRLTYDGRRYWVTSLSVVGRTAVESGLSLGRDTPGSQAAPEFSLVDQEGRSVALADLLGKAVILDFIFTHCPGPCPVMTGILKETQAALSPELRERTWFVSISLDPERDTPDVMREYAEKRGLDLSDWSLLTGSGDGIDMVLARYGVATERGEAGNIDHLVVTFVIDPRGHIVKRFLGTRHAPEDLIAELERIFS